MVFAQIPSLIFEGIPEKYPEINHIFIEAGIAWLPEYMGRMDKNYERRKHRLKHLKKKPSEYLKDKFYVSPQPIEDPAGPRNLKQVFELIDGEEMLVYSTDFPHWNFDSPAVAGMPNLDEEMEEALFGGNAMDAYDLHEL
jgi:predicted TIM-barrel fold metal-dependent hydrolase